jgi:plastocyanin
MRTRLLVTLGVAAALALAACGGGASPSAAPSTAQPSQPAASGPPAASGDTVTIEGFAFDPATLTVKVGATVTWTNRDTAGHTVKWADGSPTSAAITRGGAAYTRTFATAGSFDYACGIHPAMKGTIVVEP